MALDNEYSHNDDLYDNGLSDADLVLFATQHEQSTAGHAAGGGHVRAGQNAAGNAPRKETVRYGVEFNGFDDDLDGDDDGECAYAGHNAGHGRHGHHDPATYAPIRQSGRPDLRATPSELPPHGLSRAYPLVAQRAPFSSNAPPSKSHPETEDANTRLELERLNRELAVTREQLETKNGEVATIRRKLSQADENRQKQLRALTNELEEAKRKYQRELEEMKQEQARLRDNNRFILHDLQSISRTSHSTTTLSLRESAGNGGTTSAPLAATKRSRDGEVLQQRRGAVVSQRPANGLPFRDGFEVDELVRSPAMSSAKRQKRAQSRSLEANRQLELSQSRPEVDNLQVADGLTGWQRVLDQKASKYMQKIFNHRPFPRKERDLEILAKHRFPSEPENSVLSIVLGQLATCRSENTAVRYAKVIISLLQRCIQEKYHVIVGILMDIISYMISLDAVGFVPEMIEDLMPVLMLVCLVNGDQRYFSSPTHQEKQREDRLKQGHARSVRVNRRSTPKNLICPEVSSTQALVLMHAAISACVGTPAAMTRIWQSIRWDFIYKMLSSYQLLDDIELVIAILGYSIRPTTLGPLLGTYEMQVDNERIILDRIAHLLHEPLTTDEDASPYGLSVSTLRLRAMQFLVDAVSQFPNASSVPPTLNANTPEAGAGPAVTGKMFTNYRVTCLILQHHSILPHIFNAIYDELSQLSANPPDAKNHADLLNGLVRLAYSVTHTFPDERHDNHNPNSVVAPSQRPSTATTIATTTHTLQVDLPAKLRSATIRRIDGYARSQIGGIARKFLVSMTRIAFSERLVLDAGIDEESVNMCNEMLDECLNPQEVECLLEVFKEKEDTD